MEKRFPSGQASFLDLLRRHSLDDLVAILVSAWGRVRAFEMLRDSTFAENDLIKRVCGSPIQSSKRHGADDTV